MFHAEQPTRRFVIYAATLEAARDIWHDFREVQEDVERDGIVTYAQGPNTWLWRLEVVTLPVIFQVTGGTDESWHPILQGARPTREQIHRWLQVFPSHAELEAQFAEWRQRSREDADPQGDFEWELLLPPGGRSGDLPAGLRLLSQAELARHFGLGEWDPGTWLFGGSPPPHRPRFGPESKE